MGIFLEVRVGLREVSVVESECGHILGWLTTYLHCHRSQLSIFIRTDVGTSPLVSTDLYGRCGEYEEVSCVVSSPVLSVHTIGMRGTSDRRSKAPIRYWNCHRADVPLRHPKRL